MVEQGLARPTDLYDIITNRSPEVTEESVIEMMGMIGKWQTSDHRLTSKYSSNEGLRFKESPPHYKAGFNGATEVGKSWVESQN